VTGLIRWPATAGQYVFSIQANDGHGGIATQTSTLNVVRAETALFAEDGVAGQRMSFSELDDGFRRLQTSDLASLVDEVLGRLETGGIDQARIAAVRNTSVRIVDLPDAALGSTDGDSILIDMDAAGYGWYVDSTPSSDIPAGPMDLVTVLAHEFGHRIGLTHEDAEQDRFAFMGETLQAGVRKFV